VYLISAPVTQLPLPRQALKPRATSKGGFYGLVEPPKLKQRTTETKNAILNSVDRYNTNTSQIQFDLRKVDDCPF